MSGMRPRSYCAGSVQSRNTQRRSKVPVRAASSTRLLEREPQCRCKTLRTPKELDRRFGSLHGGAIHASADVELATLVDGTESTQGAVDAVRISKRRGSHVELCPCTRSHHVAPRPSANQPRVDRNSGLGIYQAVDTNGLARHFENGTMPGGEVNAAVSGYSAHL